MAWSLVTQKQYAVFSRFWIIESLRDEMKEVLGIGFTKYKSLDVGIYADKEEYALFRSYLVSRLESNPAEILSKCNEWLDACKRLTDYTSSIYAKPYNNYKDIELWNIIEECIAKLKKTSAYIFMAHAIDGYFEDFLDKLLAKRDNKSEERAALTVCSKATQLYFAHREFLRIAKKFGDIKNIDKYLNRFILKFGWLGYDTGVGRQLKAKDILQKIMISENKYAESKNRDTVLLQLGLTEKQKMLIHIMDDLIYARNIRGESNSIAGMHMRPLLEEIAKRCAVHYEDMIYLTPDEIKSRLMCKINISLRKKVFGVVMEDSVLKVYSGKDAKKLQDNEAIDIGTKELYGKIACSGKAKGRACIVIKAKDLKKVRRGDILVAMMTTPELMIAIERCKAIVTDIGGITSHAAIVSRELQKPCIIGTKYSTKIFEDGDILEIDNGIVRKLS